MKLKHGKYAGYDLPDVPVSYLEWLHEEARATLEAVEAELERRRLVEEAEQPWVERLVSAGYRALAKQHHPDMGGDTEAMRQLNAAVALLRGLVGRNGEPSDAVAGRNGAAR